MKSKKERKIHRWAGVLAVLILCGCLQLPAMQVRAAENAGIDAGWEETVTVTVPVPTDELPDSDELFSGYVEKIFYQELDEGISTYGNVGGDRLQGDYNKKIYAELKKYIAEAAAGTRVSTEFTLVLKEIGLEPLSWSAQNLGLAEIAKENQEEVTQAVRERLRTVVDNSSIMRYLLMDCPYELYWFDKTVRGMEMAYSYSISYTTQSVKISTLKFSFMVAEEYRLKEEEYHPENEGYLMDTSAISVISTAVSNAKSIVKDNENESDYEKLAVYREKICELTSYNKEAAGGNISYGNPWQLIWVFDGDPDTEVVCEGYSKAFQYLCDLSAFDEAVCYTVTGNMNGGGHMWNIVSFGAENYLVDVTNCDTGTIGADEQLFLAGVSGSVTGGYTASCRGGKVAYLYDETQKKLLGEDILTLSETGYESKTAVIVTVPRIETVTYGDPVDAGCIKGTAQTADGNNVPGTFLWAPDVTSYGGAGEKTLKAVFWPTDAQTFRKRSVDVELVVKKRPVAIRAHAVSKTYGDADPVLTYDFISGSLAEGDAFQGSLSRERGEEVRPDGYQIEQGTLQHPDYEVRFQPGVLTVVPRRAEVTVEVRGTYTYTGSPVIPEIQVKANGVVLGESEYVMELFDNTDAGTAAVRISPKEDGNYTWTAVEKTFSIAPVNDPADDSADDPEDDPTDDSTDGSADNPADDSTNDSAGAPQGTVLRSGKVSYKVTKNSKGVRTVAYVKPDSSKATIKVPSTVKVDGVTYKVTSIAAKAFKNNKKVTTVTIGSNVTSIGTEAFSGCSKLTKVTGCANVLTVGDKAFYGCKKLKQVGVKSSTVTLSKVKTIGKSVFYNCQEIKKVNLTSTALTKIGSSAFYGCTSMTSFTEKSTKLASIGSKAFYKDKKLASITLKTSKLTKANVGANAFKGIKSTCKIKAPSKKVKAYKALVGVKGAGPKVKVVK